MSEKQTVQFFLQGLRNSRTARMPKIVAKAWATESTPEAVAQSLVLDLIVSDLGGAK